VSSNETENPEIAKWDPAFTRRMINVMTPVVTRWFRAQVRGLESFPSVGGALVVSNHSGGVLPPDWNILAQPSTASSATTARSTPWLTRSGCWLTCSTPTERR
jgi:hypothetical protein